MLAATIGGFVGFIVPQYKSVQTLRAQAADYNQILENARTLQEQRNKLVTKYNTLDQSLLAKLNTMLPRNPENVKLILELDSIAKQYGVSLQNVKIEDAANDTQTNIRPGTAPANPDIGTLNITFSVAGSYEGFTNFIRTVERSLRIVDIRKITFTSLDETKSTYQYTVGIKTYWLK
jgi:Tfp pilus assembly protein PilO